MKSGLSSTAISPRKLCSPKSSATSNSIHSRKRSLLMLRCSHVSRQRRRRITTLKTTRPDRGHLAAKFAATDDQGNVAIRVIVTVYVDPTHNTLLSAVCRVSGSVFSAADVVRAEIESNLASVSYVRYVLTQ